MVLFIIIGFQTSFCQKINVSVSKNHLQLTEPDSIIYKFYLPKSASTSIKFINIYGGEEIIFEENNQRNKGWQEIILHSDSLQISNQGLSSGIYYLEIEGQMIDGNQIEFDSFMEPWAQVVMPEDISYSKESKEISFSIPKFSMRRIRVGLKDGILFRTFNWSPANKGINKIYWDGYTEDGAIKVSDIFDPQIVIAAFGLPETTFHLINENMPIDFNSQLFYPEDWNKFAIFNTAKNDWNTSFDTRIDFNIQIINNNAVQISFPQNSSNIEFLKMKISDDNEIYISINGEYLTEKYLIDLSENYTIEIPELSIGKHIIYLNLILHKENTAIGAKEIIVN